MPDAKATSIMCSFKPLRRSLLASIGLLAVLLAVETCFGQEQQEPETQDRFAQLDKNNDGFISPQELPRRLLFRRLDQDGDERISRAEAKAFFSERGRQQLRPVELAYGEHERNRVDVYVPRDIRPNSSAPLMIFVHGGAWRIGDKRHVDQKARFFTDQGWIFASVNYRLLPDGKHPNNVSDIAAAIAFLHDNIADRGGDRDKLFLMGHSAGCHLVSLVATDESRLAAHDKPLSILKGVIALDTGAFDVPKEAAEGDRYAKVIIDTFGEQVEAQQNGSPIYHIAADKSIPPFWVAYTYGIFRRSELPQRRIAATSFFERLRASNVQAELVDASDRSHMDINRKFGTTEDEKVTNAAFRFLEAILDDELEQGQ